MDKRNRRIVIGFAVLFALLVVMLYVNLHIGSVRISASDIRAILRTRGGEDTESRIIWSLRLPRMFAAMLLGGALSVSGFLLQTFFINPIAGPFVLGISSGAKLAVALCLIFLMGSGILPGSALLIAAAFAGALFVTMLILAISSRVKRMTLLVVCGVMVGYICNAATEIAVTFADDSNIVNLHNWSMGSFSGITWENVRVVAMVTCVCLPLAFLLSKQMEAYSLGEDYAKNAGVPLRAFRIALIVLSCVLAACVTAFAGPVSFVGIAVPHLMKNLLKTAKPVLMTPACFLGGAVFCLLCDLLARTLFAPTELSVSTVTAVFGAPVVISLLLRRHREGVLHDE